MASLSHSLYTSIIPSLWPHICPNYGLALRWKVFRNSIHWPTHTHTHANRSINKNCHQRTTNEQEQRSNYNEKERLNGTLKINSQTLIELAELKTATDSLWIDSFLLVFHSAKEFEVFFFFNEVICVVYFHEERGIWRKRRRNRLFFLLLVEKCIEKSYFNYRSEFAFKTSNEHLISTRLSQPHGAHKWTIQIE